MKPKSTILQALSLLMALAMFTNCTVYNPVRESPANFYADKQIVLRKDNLIFRLEDYYFRKDTICGHAVNDLTEPVKGKRMVLTLKPGQDLAQDSLGITSIPFSSIEYMEYFVRDDGKSKRNTILLITGVTIGTVFVIWISFSIAVFNSLNETFGNAD